MTTGLRSSWNFTSRAPLAATSRRWLFARHALGPGRSQSTAGPLTTWSWTETARVFGMIDVPAVSTFFASWKSEDESRIDLVPGLSASTLAGSGMTAMPVTGSYEVAPMSAPVEPIVSDSGSTPDWVSRVCTTSVGRPAETRVVSSFTVGGVTSFTQERSTYAPARLLFV